MAFEEREVDLDCIPSPSGRLYHRFGVPVMAPVDRAQTPDAALAKRVLGGLFPPEPEAVMRSVMYIYGCQDCGTVVWSMEFHDAQHESGDHEPG